MPRILQREGVRRAGVEPDIEDVVDLLPGSFARLPRKRSRAPSAYQASAPSASKASPMRLLTVSSFRISTEPSRFSRTNTAIGTPQARWREITQSGFASIMPVMRFSPCGGTHLVALMPASARCAQASPCRPRQVDRLVHRDEPLRRVAEDHRLLRAPGMRILVLQPAARDQRVGLGQRLDHRLVGVALLALVGEDALAGEARRVIGERAVLVDRIGDRGIDAARVRARARSRSTRRSPRGRGRAPCARSRCRRRPTRGRRRAAGTTKS